MFVGYALTGILHIKDTLISSLVILNRQLIWCEDSSYHGSSNEKIRKYRIYKMIYFQVIIIELLCFLNYDWLQQES